MVYCKVKRNDLCTILWLTGFSDVRRSLVLTKEELLLDLYWNYYKEVNKWLSVFWLKYSRIPREYYNLKINGFVFCYTRSQWIQIQCFLPQKRRWYFLWYFFWCYNIKEVFRGYIIPELSFTTHTLYNFMVLITFLKTSLL